MTVPFEQRPETIQGRRAELAVSDWLQRRGWHILPAYDYAGDGERKAPRLDGLPHSYVVPDLLCAKDGVCRWAEVKWKAHADYTFLTGRKETGIARRLWNEYIDVQRVTGVRVWLVFVHQAEDEIRGAPLADLMAGTCVHSDPVSPPPTLRFYDGQKMGRSGMVFFCWDCLHFLTRTSDVLQEAAA